MPRVVHFDITADQPERAIRFYQDIFGWKFQKWEGGGLDYWLITTGEDTEPGINGGLARRAPESGNLNSIGVSSVEEHSAMITQAGGAVLRPKMAIPGVGWFALCQDTEGNAFGLFQNDTSAV